MDIVIDTSAVMAVVANEPTKEALIALTAGMRMIAPRSLPWEMGNAFSAMLKRKRVTPEQAHAGLKVYRTLPIRLVEVDLDEAIGVAAEFGLYAYDAYFMTVARREACELLTLDRGLVHAAKQAGIPVREVSS